MRVARLVAVPAGLAMALLAGPAAASCAGPPAFGEHLAMADAVFVGTVVELSNADRTAVVTVEEIWRGPALPRTVTVHGGTDDPNSFSSVDRTYALGRYLFAVLVADGTLHDNSCSATREWMPELAEMQPAEVSRPPEPNEQATDESLPVAVLVAGTVALALAALGVLAFRTRR